MSKKEELKALRSKQFLWFLLFSVLDQSASVLNVIGLTLAPLTLYSVLLMISVPASTILSILIFKEKYYWNHYLGIAISILGIIISTLGDIFNS